MESFAMKISRQINQRLFGVSLLSNFELKASTGVTKTQTSTNANGEKIVDCWENVNVDANGEIMASTRCKNSSHHQDKWRKNRGPLGKC